MNHPDAVRLESGWITAMPGNLRLGAFWMAAALPFAATAHDPGISTAQGQLKPGAIEIVTGFAPADARQFLPSDLHVSDQWDDSEFEAVREHLEVMAAQLWEASVDGIALNPDEASVQFLPGDNVSFRVILPLPSRGERLILRSAKFAELPPGHRQFVLVFDQDGSTVAKALLSPRAVVLEVPLPSPSVATAGVASGRSQAWMPARSGFEHPWAALDHFGFLLAAIALAVLGFRRRKGGFARGAILGLSVLVGAVGLYWLFERIALP